MSDAVSNTASTMPFPKMTPRVFAGTDALGRYLADKLMGEIAKAQNEGRRYLLGCPTGRTPKPVYAEMTKALAKHNQSLSHLVLVMMDEYIVPGPGGAAAYAPANAHFSCHRFARDDIAGMFNAVLPPSDQVPLTQVWFPDPADPTAYDRRIAEAGGIDFFLLASGAGDGHVAFNPPGSGKDTISRIVTLAEQTRRDNLSTFPDFKDLTEVPLQGITVGIATIASAKAAAMILTGEGKRHAFHMISTAGVYDPAWPASVVHLIEHAEILADAAAANKEQQDAQTT